MKLNRSTMITILMVVLAVITGKGVFTLLK